MPISADNFRDPRACRDPFPFVDHLTVAEVDELAALRARRVNGPLDFDSAMRMFDLKCRSHPTPPPTDSPPPPSRAA